MLTRTASIGIAVLKCAIGLRKAYKECIEISAVDLERTGCHNCMHFISSSASTCTQSNFPFSDACDKCMNRLMSTDFKNVYVNEKNRYGIRHELKKNALMLFLYLHYLNPDDSGLVHICIEDAALELHCTERTIRNNLKLLNRHKYIALSASQVFPGYYKLFLPEYKSYFLPADRGGRGYCVLPLEHLRALVELPDINSIRLAVRNLIPETVSGKQSHFEKSYVEVQRDLPAYCSKRKIRDLTASKVFTKIFDVQPKKYFIKIKARAEYDVNNIAASYKAECKDKLTALIDTLRREASSRRERNKILLLENEVNDICGIALKIPLQYVLKAVRTVNEVYILPNLPINNMGALVRTIAMDLFQMAI